MKNRPGRNHSRKAVGLVFFGTGLCRCFLGLCAHMMVTLFLVSTPEKADWKHVYFRLHQTSESKHVGGQDQNIKGTSDKGMMNRLGWHGRRGRGMG